MGLAVLVPLMWQGFAGEVEKMKRAYWTSEVVHAVQAAQTESIHSHYSVLLLPRYCDMMVEQVLHVSTFGTAFYPGDIES